MKKSIHIYLDNDLVKSVYELAKKEKLTKSDEIEKVIRLGLAYDDFDKKIEMLINLINKNTSSLLYIKKLDEQIYADLGFSQIDPSDSNNLKLFKDKYRKEKNRFND